MTMAQRIHPLFLPLSKSKSNQNHTDTGGIYAGAVSVFSAEHLFHGLSQFIRRTKTQSLNWFYTIPPILSLALACE